VARYRTRVTWDTETGSPPRWSSLLLVLLIALGLRLGWALSRPVTDASIDALPDQRNYLSIAENLIHGRGMQFLDKRFGDAVYAYRTPGYPVFVAALGAKVRVIRGVQAILDAATVLAIFLLTFALTGRQRAALCAAVLVAINPYLIYFTALILSETLFAAMLAWGMWLLVIGNSARSPGRATLLWLGGAVLLTLSVLVRPSAIALPLVLGLACMFLNRASGTTYSSEATEKPSLGPGAWPFPVGWTMVGLLLLCLLPWAARNRAILGRWVWLDTNGGFTFYDGYNPDATGASDQRFIEREPELQALGEVGRSEYLTQKAVDYAKANPLRVWDLIGAKLARTWSPVPLSEEYHRPALMLVSIAYSIPFYALVLLGMSRGNLSRSAKVFLLAPAVYFSIIHALTVGSLRYRIPAEPPMAVIAAGLVGTWGGSGRRAPSE